MRSEGEIHADAEERREVIRRYARLRPNGTPVCCTPTREELSGEAGHKTRWGNDGKIIFDDRESAEACARVLESIGCKPARAYECKRSSRHHHHLTTEGAAEDRERRRRGAGKGKRRGAKW